MKILIFSIWLSTFSVISWAQNTGVQILINGIQHTCRPDGEVRCARNCQVRGINGCVSYGTDYCGVDAACVPNCQVRGSDGCISYGADYCGGNAQCTPTCSVRGINGDCISYTRDTCTSG